VDQNNRVEKLKMNLTRPALERLLKDDVELELSLSRAASNLVVERVNQEQEKLVLRAIEKYRKELIGTVTNSWSGEVSLSRPIKEALDSLLLPQLKAALAKALEELAVPSLIKSRVESEIKFQLEHRVKYSTNYAVQSLITEVEHASKPYVSKAEQREFGGQTHP
jgi:hypothetical protein